jgi:RimJ/RimL family protein N-acetyltransferase
MKFETGQFRFDSIDEHNLETVRQWRNLDIVRLAMIYREPITPEKQQEWFQTILNTNNIYYVSHYKGEAIGVNNLKNICYEKNTAEGGVFVGNEKYLHSEVAVVAAFYLSYFAFHALGINTILAKVIAQNTRAGTYSNDLGFTLIQSENNIQWWQMSKEDFQKKAPKIIKAAQVLFGFDNKWKLSMYERDIELGFLSLLLDRLSLAQIQHHVTDTSNCKIIHIDMNQQ